MKKPFAETNQDGMYNFLIMTIDNLSKEDKIFAGAGALYGWIASFILLDAMSFWGYIVKGFYSIVWLCVSTLAVLVLKSVYKYAEPKTIFFFKTKVFIKKWKRSIKRPDSN